jgi:imidazolonepropionase-like amidohydrolase
VLLSGGVANDPIENCYYSAEELAAIVDEATAWNTYVIAHSYTARSTRHAVLAGVRSIEHGNLIDRETVDLMVARDVFLVPTLVAYEAVYRAGDGLGLPDSSMRKLKQVTGAGLASIEMCAAAGVPIGFGTDLQGVLHDQQSLEFSLRAEVQSPHAVIAAATAVNAKLLRREGELGVIAPGAVADILVVDGDPLRDLGLLQDQGAHLSVIMQAGRFHKNVPA